MEMGGGYWVKIVAHKVEPSEAKPHGIDYSLCLFSSDDERLVCFDNAHPVRKKGFARPKVVSANDHVHMGKDVESYPYVDAEGLMHDFWEAVDQILAAKGV